MARIRFLRDFRGVNTNGQFFLAGEVIEHDNASAIVAEGAAEFVGDLDVSSPPVESPTVAAVVVDVNDGVSDTEATIAGKALRARRKRTVDEPKSRKPRRGGK